MLDGRSLDVISKFKLALLTRAEKPANYGYLPVANRGRKLDRGEGAASSALTPKIVEYNGTNHLVLSNDAIERSNYRNKRRWLSFYPSGKKDASSDELSSDEKESGDDDYDAENDENPLKKLRLSEILAPLAHPSELATHPAISRTYKLVCLATLASDLIHSIEIEQKTLNQFNKLLQVLDGEDWFYQLEDNMDLPVYDHGVDDLLAEIVNEAQKKPGGVVSRNTDSCSTAFSNSIVDILSDNSNPESNHTTSSATIFTNSASAATSHNTPHPNSNNKSGSINGAAGTRSKSDGENASELTGKNGDANVYKRTRGATADDKFRITDPFFALPRSLVLFDRQQQKQLEEDEDKDDDPLEVLKQDLRNYLHVSIQRQHECIKNLTTIRNGLVKADKYKRDLFRWGKEMSEKK